MEAPWANEYMVTLLGVAFSDFPGVMGSSCALIALDLISQPLWFAVVHWSDCSSQLFLPMDCVLHESRHVPMCPCAM